MTVDDCCMCALLWQSIVDLTFGRQLYDILTVFRLNIFLNICSFGKLLSTIVKNDLPMFVFTRVSNGGLYQVILRLRFFAILLGYFLYFS